MKNIRFLLFFFFIVIFFSSQGQDIGSSWTIMSPGAGTTQHELIKGKGMCTLLKKKQKTIVFRENKINENTYSKRFMQLRNRSTGEVLFEQELKLSETNIVTIPLKPIKEKYGESIYEQEFIMIELADELESSGYIYFRYKDSKRSGEKKK
ncbi:MAG: hypothetical protein HOG05_09110 [Bacteroidetes bacterium]|jgi:hypothetical protein|nr:hypothetical protein [Bacteroidota bacterium]MBT5529295.1 hypothetical protein [Cytophagia bacterium]MBT3801300.1 hypothetical protein [Bacteroidota bacterium]MBT3934926.1 hypothetical protein [Bacteroidota bacterium]MBT4728887.1 hypothetical protein [Bacteroidota bacterium]